MRLEDAQVGMRVRIAIPGDKIDQKEGTIMRIGGATDSDFDQYWARMFPIEVSVDGYDYTQFIFQGHDGVTLYSTFKPEELEAI